MVPHLMWMEAAHNHSRPLRLIDIAEQLQKLRSVPLSDVGMSGIEIPIRLKVPEGEFLLPSKVDAFVSLDKGEAKGIHMSRLYRLLTEELPNTPFSQSLLTEGLSRMIASQEGLSDEGLVRISTQIPSLRRALKSDLKGWRHYPVIFEVERRAAKTICYLNVEVLYSSTCPCSAALARQLVQEKFLSDFPKGGNVDTREVYRWLGEESSMAALPHAQRSRAMVRVELASPEVHLSAMELIDAIEMKLQTPVQTAVKREDEQEFARLNASNLMFCEDAARRLHELLDADSRIANFWLQVEHQESLHPHDAVARSSKRGALPSPPGFN